MNTVRIVTDSSCDLPDDVIDAAGIVVVPLSIRFGDTEYLDRDDLSNAEFWSRCARSETLPETAAPAPGAFEAAYRELAIGGATGVVVVSLSAAMSATFQSAGLGARAITDDIDVRVIDSRTASLGLGSIALACARSAGEGAPIGDVEALGRDLVTRTHVIGALDTLENLKKGGRIGGARAFLATALSIKPLIEVVDGVVEPAGKQRTRSKALAQLVDRVRRYSGKIEQLAVLHADCSDVDQFVELLRPLHDGEIIVGEIGPVIGTHTGRGAIGVALTERR